MSDEATPPVEQPEGEESAEPQEPEEAEQKPAESAEQKSAESDWQRRRRLAAVFGDVLPETTSDERGEGDRGAGGDGGNDEWLRRQVPPHHG